MPRKNGLSTENEKIREAVNMSVFDQLGKKIKDGGQGVVQKTKDTAEILKLNSMISNEEKHINSLYAEIGKVYFAQHAEDCEPMFSDLVSAVREANAKIREYTQKVQELKGYVPCPNCGSNVPGDAQFCVSCGFKMAMQTAQNTTDCNARLCQNCGAPLGENMAFCTKCGTKVSEEAPVEAPAVAEPENVCPQCGAQVAPGGAFCTACGAKLNEK